jgi:dimethylamine/trimethylamine dehydrogenase
VPGFDGANVYAPDDLMSGRVPTQGPVIVWDDDHYYMGGVLAELCRARGLDVTLVTPAAMVSAWTVNTLESLPIAKRTARLGIQVVTYASVAGFDGAKVQLVNGLTDAASERSCASLVTVTARLPVDDLFEQLRDRWQDAGIASLARIGDCLAPSTIQQAVYSGHKWARELDEPPEVLIPRELPMIESGRVKATL